ncbi:hypothetical protein ACKVWC_008548 [Pyricularia oryzae]
MRFTSAVIVALLASGAIAGGKGMAEANGIQHGERVTLANLLAKESRVLPGRMPPSCKLRQVQMSR